MTDTTVLERPLLLRTAEPRNEGEALPGRYCPDAAVWVVDTNHGAKPIVEIGGTALNETQTKTMSQVE